VISNGFVARVWNAGLLLLISASMSACSTVAQSPVDQVDAEAVYAQYCGLCHGPLGEGYAADAANALSNASFLGTASNQLIRRAIQYGRPGTPMSAWAQELGGPLSAVEVEALVQLIRSWQSTPSIAVDNLAVDGVALRGEPLFSYYCTVCHGEAGAGGTFLSIQNPEFLASATDGFLRYAIQFGRPGTAMPAYGDMLTPQNIDDLVALIRSWQVEPTSRFGPPPSKDLGDPVLNAGGPEPEFSVASDELYVSVEEVKSHLDAGAAMVFLDARPPTDYVQGHISGAVSVPFYGVAEFLDQLPKDIWIIAYCACPHAESTQASAVLKANGYTKVKVLDEGYNVWKESGYPVTIGATP
jgi:cytochrome c oxidase cbb3-type subunit 3